MRYMEIEDKYIDRLTKKMNVAAKYGREVVTTIFNGEEYIALLRTESNESVYKPETFKFRV
mgnify:FL=1